MSRAAILLSLGLTVGALAGAPATAVAEVGDLEFRGCVTSEAESGPPPVGTGACRGAGALTPGGVDSGLHLPESVAVSPDGRSVYAVSGEDDSLARFDRDPGTGELSFGACISGQASIGAACSAVPAASFDGAGSGLDDPESVTVSPDGVSVYVTTRGDDSIVRFNRTPATGAVAFGGCVTGETETAAACTALDPAADGADTGFDDLKTKEVAISADGRSLYAGSELDDAVLRFDRNPFSGALAYEGCITGETESGPAGSGHCAAIATATPGGASSGLDSIRWVELSPDGRWLYALGQLDDAVARFARDPGTGTLAYAGCITAEIESTAACAPIPGAAPSGLDTGLDDPRAIGISTDGTQLLVGSGGDSAIASFTRDPASGDLGYLGCLSGEAESGPAPGSGACSLTPSAAPGAVDSGLRGIRDLELAADDRSFYVAAQFDGVVAEFERDPGGTFRLSSCHSGRIGPAACQPIGSATASGDDSGLADPETVAITADGTSLIASVEADSALAGFAREPFVAPPPPDTLAPETTITRRPKPNSKKRRAIVSFISNEPGSSFECSLDDDPFFGCNSPLRTRKLRRRRHTFEVRAVDAADNADPTPARAKWKVRRKKRRK